MRPSSSATTALAEVGLMLPKRLALGAASAEPSPWMTAFITGLALCRTATVASPAVTMSGTVSRFGKTEVSGPGQNSLASRRMIFSTPGGTSAT